MSRHTPRPRDTNQLAKMIVDIATGQVKDEPVAVSGRAAGGKARAASMTPERRREIAKRAAAARWANGTCATT